MDAIVLSLNNEGFDNIVLMNGIVLNDLLTKASENGIGYDMLYANPTGEVSVNLHIYMALPI